VVVAGLVGVVEALLVTGLVVGAEALVAVVLAVPIVEALEAVILGAVALPAITDKTMVLFIITMVAGIGAWVWIQRTKHLKDLPIHKE